MRDCIINIALIWLSGALALAAGIWPVRNKSKTAKNPKSTEKERSL